LPVISVIIPVYNGEQYLQQTIDSVKAQTFSDWELIAVNDGSTDNTAALLKTAAEEDSRIVVLSQENAGMGKARNSAIAVSRGQYLAFVDADDLWQPLKLEKQLQAITSTGADLIYTSGHTFSGSPTNTIKYWQVPPGMHSYTDFFVRQLYGFTVPVLSVLVRKDKVLEVGGFVEDKKAHLAADYQLWLKLMDRNALFYGIDESLFLYRVHDKQSTAGNSLALDQVLWALKEADLQSISVKSKCKVMEQRLNRFLVHNVQDLAKEDVLKFVGLYKSILQKNTKHRLMKLAYQCGMKNFKRVGYKYLDLSENFPNS
jgi:glycosyltransferase involved in cell wall biosynthesis